MRKLETRDAAGRTMAGVAVAACLALCAAGVYVGPVQHAQAKTSQPNGIHKVNGAYYFYKKGVPVKNAWRTVGKKRYRFGADGKAATGLTRVGKNWYYFSAKGVMQKGSSKGLTQSRKIKAGKWTYFLNNKYQLEARKKGGAYYYNNGDQMTSADRKDYTTWIIAQGIAKKNTKPTDSRKTKRLKMFKWVMAGYYKMWRNFRQSPDWPAVYAMDHFKHRCGDCNSDGAAFTYLAAAIGDEAYVCQDTTLSVNAAHAWCEIDGWEYDPLFAQAKSFSRYYGGKKSTPVTKIKIPYFSPSHVNGQGWVPGRVRTSSTKRGLTTVKGNLYYYKGGKAVTGKWVTVKGKKYYFGASGKAATGSVKVKIKNGSKKRAYFVFGENHVLKTGSKERVVSVDKVKYRVSAKGRALKGWTRDSKGAKVSYFFADGHRAAGVAIVNKKLRAFSGKGIYKEKKTKKLKAAAKQGKDAAKLLKLMGTPLTTIHQNSCIQDGAQDWLYTYENVAVQTLKTDGAETVYSVTAL